MTSKNEKDVLTSGFSSEWEQKYAQRTHLSIWPWSDLVSYTVRYAKPVEDFSTVLELGCGAGANIPFFLDRGNEYYAVDGSPSIVKRLIERFPHLADRIVCGDFTRAIPFATRFDLVVDRGSLTCNDTAGIRQCLSLVCEKMRDGGVLIGIDWFSSDHSDASKGVAVDSHTRKDLQSTLFEGIGNAHFTDRAHLSDLLGVAGFEITVLEKKASEMLVGGNGLIRDAFNFVAVKK